MTVFGYTNYSNRGGKEKKLPIVFRNIFSKNQVQPKRLSLKLYSNILNIQWQYEFIQIVQLIIWHFNFLNPKATGKVQQGRNSAVNNTTDF